MHRPTEWKLPPVQEGIKMLDPQQVLLKYHHSLLTALTASSLFPSNLLTLPASEFFLKGKSDFCHCCLKPPGIPSPQCQVHANALECGAHTSNQVLICPTARCSLLNFASPFCQALGLLFPVGHALRAFPFMKRGTLRKLKRQKTSILASVFKKANVGLFQTGRG